MCPGRIGLVRLKEGEATQDSSARFLRVFEDAGRQGSDTDLLDGQATSGEDGLPRRVRGEDLLDDLELLFHDRELALGRRVHLRD